MLEPIGLGPELLNSFAADYGAIVAGVYVVIGTFLTLGAITNMRKGLDTEYVGLLWFGLGIGAFPFTLSPLITWVMSPFVDTHSLWATVTVPVFLVGMIAFFAILLAGLWVVAEGVPKLYLKVYDTVDRKLRARAPQ